jgi:hypothetical protein
LEEQDARIQELEQKLVAAVRAREESAGSNDISQQHKVNTPCALHSELEESSSM